MIGTAPQSPLLTRPRLAANLRKPRLACMPKAHPPRNFEPHATHPSPSAELYPLLRHKIRNIEFKSRVRDSVIGGRGTIAAGRVASACGYPAERGLHAEARRGAYPDRGLIGTTLKLQFFASERRRSAAEELSSNLVSSAHRRSGPACGLRRRNPGRDNDQVPTGRPLRKLPMRVHDARRSVPAARISAPVIGRFIPIMAITSSTSPSRLKTGPVIDATT